MLTSNKKASAGTFQPSDTPIRLSVSPSVKATGTIEAHLIPSLNLGIFALDGIVGAEVFLALDASTVMQLGLEAQGEASVTLNKAQTGTIAGRHYRPKQSAKSANPKRGTDQKPAVKSTVIMSTSTGTTDIATKSDTTINASGTGATVTNTVTKGDAVTRAAGTGTGTAGNATQNIGVAIPTTSDKIVLPSQNTSSASGDASGSFGGCFEIKTGLDVNAGAEGSFFGLFDTSTQVSLFNKEFELFKKCFGSGAAVRRSIPRVSRLARVSLEGRVLGLECFAVDTGSAVEVLADTINAARSFLPFHF